MKKISVYICDGIDKEYKDFLSKNITHPNFDFEFKTEKDKFADLVALANQIQSNQIARAIVIDEFGTLPFMIMAKFKHIVVAQVADHHSARMTIQHNNSNVLALPFKILGKENMLDVINAYLQADFEAGRHMVRINMLDVILQEE